MIREHVTIRGSVGPMSRPFALLLADMHRAGVTLEAYQQEEIRKAANPVSIPPNALVLSQARGDKRTMFLAGGIAASEHCWPDGSATIGRFYEAGDLCSIPGGDMAAHDIIAITAIDGLAFPSAWIQEHFMHGTGFGTYLRWRSLQAQRFERDLICVKTSARTERRLDFLRTHHRDVLALAPQKDIARFLGVTPQGLSRFLRKSRALSGGDDVSRETATGPKGPDGSARQNSTKIARPA